MLFKRFNLGLCFKSFMRMFTLVQNAFVWSIKKGRFLKRLLMKNIVEETFQWSDLSWCLKRLLINLL
jgi:hypothetical protein